MAIKEFRGKIRAVFPYDGLKVRINRKLAEFVHILERLEDFSIKFLAEIHFAFDIIIETDVDNVVMKIASFFDMQNHEITPNL